MLLNEFMDTRLELAKKIMEYIHQEQTTIDVVARKIGINARTLISLAKGHPVSFLTLSKVTKFLNEHSSQK